MQHPLDDQRLREDSASTNPPQSPLTVFMTTGTSSIYSPSCEAEDWSIKQEPPRTTLLPVFADLIRASHLANRIDVSPLLVSKNSLRFILDGARHMGDHHDDGASDAVHMRSPSAKHDVDESITPPRSTLPSPLSPVLPAKKKHRTSKPRPPNRTCKFEGCTQYVVDHGHCVRHGGGKRCTMEGCTSRAKHYGRCWRHGGSMECKIDGCANRAKSRGYCWSHGGGTKCKADDCDKIAISNGLCWAHGVGKRCASPGCMKQAYERTDNLCTAHYRHAKKLDARQAAAAH